MALTMKTSFSGYKEMREHCTRIIMQWKKENPKLIPDTRRYHSTLLAKRKYRRKEHWVVGYCWHRPYSHHMSGRVYDAILAWGETQELAIDMLEAKFLGKA